MCDSSETAAQRAVELKTELGLPLTLGNAAAAKVRLIVWCRDCGHQVEADPAEQAQCYGADTPVLNWRDRLVASEFDTIGRRRLGRLRPTGARS